MGAPRVLLGRFGPIARLGLEAVLREGGCEVISCGDESLLVGAARAVDAVVVDLDAPGARRRANDVAARGVCVVGVSVERPTMLVLDSGTTHAALSVRALLRAVGAPG